MDVSLGDHFSEDADEATYRFVLSTMTATSARPELIEGLVALMARNKADPTVTDDLLAAAGWTTAAAALRKGRLAVRRGDFGEVLAAEAAEGIDEMFVPVRKLRYQIDSNQTLPGSDVVAFVLDREGATIDDLEFIESKYRTDPARDLAVEAHEQLGANREGGYATTINFIAHRLRELDATLYSEFIDFLSSRDVKECAHAVVLTYDAENWDDEIAVSLDSLPSHLPELQLRLFPLERAIDLIEETYAALLWDVIADE
jgi:Cap4 SAVED domain